jgi:hypothetical protein
MAIYERPTDQSHQIQLDSTIEQVMWSRTLASPGGTIGLEVFTHYVGNGAEMTIALRDHTGASFGTYDVKLYGNRWKADVVVPPEARQALYAKAKLPKHGLEKESAPLLLLPNIEVKNAKWSQETARRGDIVTLTADVLRAPDGMETLITVFEHDDEGAHEMITKMLALVDGERVEVDWEFNFPGDVEEIPSHDETEEGYLPPRFFFRVDALGKTADSGLLTFQDMIEIEVVDHEEVPLSDLEYKVTFADGTEQEGTLDENGYARIEDVPPGKFHVEVF